MVFFCFQTWLFKPWLLNPAMTNWTECFLQAHHYIFGCNSGTNIKALFFMKILCIFIQTRFWHNLIECLFWSQYQTHSTVTTTYINRKCTLWIIVFVPTHFFIKNIANWPQTSPNLNARAYLKPHYGNGVFVNPPFNLHPD